MENIINTTGIRIIKGTPKNSPVPYSYSTEEISKVIAFHKTVDGYEPTPLVSLAELARQTGVAGIFIKDESPRFGLNAFKGLGGIYAIARIVARELRFEEVPSFKRLQESDVIEKVRNMVFATTTDGNHGKGVAWAAGKFGCKVIINMPIGTVEERADAIRKVNPKAIVTITDMNYDDTVRMTAGQAEENGWFLVQDTAWEGYNDIPDWISQGYSTIVAEIKNQLSDYGNIKPTHVFLQAGVGSMAGAVLGCLINTYHDNPPVTIIVEPDVVACFFESVKENDGDPHSIGGTPHTIMAGLNCGEPNVAIWPLIRDHAALFASCPDYVAAHGMRMLAAPVGRDDPLISGESGAAGFGLAHLILTRPELEEYRQMLKIDERSVILTISTEGATYKEGYDEIVKGGEYPEPF